MRYNGMATERRGRLGWPVGGPVRQPALQSPEAVNDDHPPAPRQHPLHQSARLRRPPALRSISPPGPKTALLNPMNRCATVREVEYALARQLEQAGFPQAGKGTWTGPADHLTWRRTDLVYQPTLDELIAAVRAIEPSITLQCAGDVWIACVVYAHFERYGEAPSPADAVASLWLLLQQLIATASPDRGACP